MKLIIVLLIAFACLPYSASAGELMVIDNTPDFIAKPATRDLIKQLRNGGYVLYICHGNTDTSRPDRLPNIDLNDCSTQRPLTEEGWRVSAKIGREIRKAKIPASEIISSPMCRAKDTALAAFGNNFTVNNLLMYTSNMTDKDKKPVLDATRELLSRPLEGKVNRILIGHAQNLMDIIVYLPKPEGTVVIFQPMGDRQFKYIASIAPDQWKKLHP